MSQFTSQQRELTQAGLISDSLLGLVSAVLYFPLLFMRTLINALRKTWVVLKELLCNRCHRF